MIYFKSPKNILLLIIIFLFFIPFFWMNPGEMDLGGDSNRLYFYDPLHYLQNNLLYAINPGFGDENPLYLSLPFVGILVIFKKLLSSSYLLITVINSLKLIVSFLAMFGISKHLLSHFTSSKNRKIIYFISIFVGIYYILSPVMIRSAWDKALLTHFQIFLNPLVFFLFLRYFETNKIKYLLSVLITTFIFSTNFSWAAAPPLFAFYPITIAFLIIYAKIILKKKIAFRPIIISICLFFLMHAFHIAPLVGQLFSHSGGAFARSFTNEGKFDIGLNYFLSIAPSITLSNNLLGLPQAVPKILPFAGVFGVFILIIVWGLIQAIKQRNVTKEYLSSYILILTFLLISIFLATANITKTGFAFYSSLFSIPGFSMFRNFYGQWEFVYLFFMSLAIGFGLLSTLIAIKSKRFQYSMIFALTVLIFGSALPFIRGDMINFILNKEQKIEFKVPIKMDPNFENALSYIRNDQSDGKILVFPHTESFSQMLAGTQQGMYQGPSILSALTGKQDFVGYQVITPFSEVFLSLAKKGAYDDLTRLFNLLNIKYVFYNSDPLIMDYFPDFPYSHVKNFLPQNQTDYQKFIAQLPVTKKKSFGAKFHLYELDRSNYLPHIYVAKEVVKFNKKLDQWGYLSEPFFIDSTEKRTIYLEEKIPYSTFTDIPKITIIKVNPTKYYIHVTDANSPYMLGFSEKFNPNWKIFLSKNTSEERSARTSYFNGDITELNKRDELFDRKPFETWMSKPLAENSHYQANGYANAWLIKPSDVQSKNEYSLILELTSQKLFYIFVPIALAGFLICLSWLVIDLIREKREKI